MSAEPLLPRPLTPPRCVMVTGGLGFIGSYVAEAAFETYPEAKIVVVDRYNYAASIRNVRGLSASPRFSLECLDLSDEAAVRAAVSRHRPSLIFHLAAETHVDRSFGNALDFTRGNVLGTHVLLEAARTCWEAAGGSGSNVFVHMSTDEVYGSGEEAGEGGHAPKTSILAPTNPYAASKAAAEMQCLAYHRSFGMDVRIVRCNNVYGPRQFCEKVVPRFSLQALAGRPLTVHGDGSQQRSFLHASDAASALLVVASRARAGEIVNVGETREMSVLELAGRVAALAEDVLLAASTCASPSAPGASAAAAASAASPSASRAAVFGRDRLFNDYRYPVNVGRITELGWAPRVDLEAGLRATIDWYRVHKDEWFCPEDLNAAVFSDGHFSSGPATASSPSPAIPAPWSSGRGSIRRIPEGGSSRRESLPLVLVYGSRGWIGGKLMQLLKAMNESATVVEVFEGRVRLEDTAGLWQELRTLAPTHVICAAGITGRPNIDWCERHAAETVAVNLEGTATLSLFCARLGVHFTNFATGCIYAGGETVCFSEDDEPNFAGSLYSRTKIHAEKIQRGAAGSSTLLLRLRMPIDSDFGNSRNLVNKLCRYSRLVDLPNSVSVLPELLPIALHMALRGTTGVFNLTNPGWTTPADIREAFDKVRVEHNVYRSLPPLSGFVRETNAQSLVSSGVIVAQRSNCVLDASKLSAYAAAHGLPLRPAREAVRALLGC
jgi:UDP-glucose 4,6-dehydratase